MPKVKQSSTDDRLISRSKKNVNNCAFENLSYIMIKSKLASYPFGHSRWFFLT